MHVCIIIYLYALYAFLHILHKIKQSSHIVLHEVMRNKKEEREKKKEK